METPNTASRKEKQVAPLNLTRLSQTEYVNQDHSITVDIETSLEDLESPDFWAHCAPYFTQYDKIRVSRDDSAWYAELLIVACDRNSARVKLMTFVELDAAVASQEVPIKTLSHEVKFRGPHHKWCVIRNADGALLKTGMKRDEANAWLAEYLRTTKQ